MKIDSLMEMIVQHSAGGYIVTDPYGKIIFINNAYCRFLGKAAEEVLGKPIVEVLPNSRLPEVAKSGTPAMGVWQKQGDDYLFGHRIPLYRAGKIVAAMGQLIFQKPDDVKNLVQKMNQLQSQLEFYQEELNLLWSPKHTFDSIVGHSSKISAAKKIAQKAAASDATVLIQGETGVGKEVFAHAIHSASKRYSKPFIKINCAAIPYDLLESELFGYEEGAFTGAKKRGKPGKFELANEGTLFLDEIGDMPLNMQAKVLRVLQEREAERVGGLRPFKVNARIIAATNQGLEQAVKDGRFRADLFYRLNVLPINLPPLRERREDIPDFIEAALTRVTRQLKCTAKRIKPEALKVLGEYPWPGNVRELFNVIERMANLIDGDEIGLTDLPLGIFSKNSRSHAGKARSLRGIVEEAEKEAIVQALKEAKGNVTLAAKMLGIHRVTLHDKLKIYAIDSPKT